LGIKPKVGWENIGFYTTEQTNHRDVWQVVL
jgi:hypothetical protein